MTEAEVRQVVCELVAKLAPEADLRLVEPGENLREALDLDSFDFLKLLVGLHERLGVEIPEADYARVATLAGLIGYLVERTK
jgi:acyl carrier protein